jgi:ribonuclease BN (tRNA processing enzyme)
MRNHTLFLLCVFLASSQAHLQKTAAEPPKTQIVLLGTGTPYADPDRSGPAVAIVIGGTSYIVDAGPGVVRRAAAAAQKTKMNALAASNLRFVFLTHLHSDHTLGYRDLIFSPVVLDRENPLEAFGPKGLQEMTDHLLAAWKKDLDVRIHGLEHGHASGYQVHVHEINPGVIYRDENVTVKAFLVKHSSWDQAFGYRFEARDRTVVISGDTVPTPSVAEACSGCDVLIHEVYCQRGFEKRDAERRKYHSTAHSSSLEVAQIARQAKPKLLVLYHQLFFGCSEAELFEEVRKAYSGKVVSGRDLDVF